MGTVWADMALLDMEVNFQEPKKTHYYPANEQRLAMALWPGSVFAGFKDEEL